MDSAAGKEESEDMKGIGGGGGMTLMRSNLFWEWGQSGVLEDENPEEIKLLVLTGPGLRGDGGCGRLEGKITGEEVELPCIFY